MYKYLFVLFFCLTVSYANEASEVARKKHDIKLLFGGGIATYLTFLAIKFKIIVVIGTIITIALIIGKIFFLVKYGALLWEKKKDFGETIVFSDPHSHGYYSGGHGPGPEISYDAPPPNYFDSDHHHDHHEEPPEHYERSIGNSISENINMMKEIFDRMDLTEYAFKSMRVKSDYCKRRFVCEADFHGKENSLLALGLYMFSETGFSKYRGKTLASTIEDCEKMYSDCSVNT